MKRSLRRVAASVLCVVTVLTATARPAGAIIGGTVSDPAAYPYFVKVVSSTDTCGGSVIDASWVLTAAHCVDNDVTTPGIVLVVRMVAGDPGDSYGSSWNATQVIVHPLWNWAQPDLGHDVALVRVPAGVLAAVPAVQAGSPWDPGAYLPDTVVAAMGYGRTVHDGPPARRLLAVDTVLRSDEYMDDRHSPWPSQLLLGAGTRYQGVCFGDSGGPLVLTRNGQVVQVGVVKEGVAECDAAATSSELNGPQLAWVASHVPSIAPRWDPCVSPYGTIGHSVAHYGLNWVPGVQQDGPYYWHIRCHAPNAVVPALRGMYLAQAVSTLNAVGLYLGAVSYTPDTRCEYLNQVMRQSPSSGTTVAPGTSVNLTIGTRPRICL